MSNINVKIDLPSLEWNVAVANPVMPVAGGPEGGQGDGAALVTVSKVTYEGFSKDLLRAVQRLVFNFSAFCALGSFTWERQIVFLCSALRG